MIKYKVYPTLLDEFARYKSGKSNEEALINRINRVRDFDDELLKKMQKGIDFEKAVIGEGKHSFDPKIIEQFKSVLPKSFKTQVFLNFNYQNIHFYGYADVVGENRVIDIKTTSRYYPERYENGFQNLYLYALKDMGFETMEYLICDFSDETQLKMHHIVLPLNEIDFQKYLDMMVEFTEFLEEHRGQVTDQRIFVKQEGLFG